MNQQILSKRVLFISDWPSETKIAALQDKGYDVTNYDVNEADQLVAEVHRCKEQSRRLVLVTPSMLDGAKLNGKKVDGEALALAVREAYPQAQIVGYSKEFFGKRLDRKGIEYFHVLRTYSTDSDIPYLLEAVGKAFQQFPSPNQARELHDQAVEAGKLGIEGIHLVRQKTQ